MAYFLLIHYFFRGFRHAMPTSYAAADISLPRHDADAFIRRHDVYG